MNEVKQIILQMFCKHDWQIQTISETGARKKCVKCGVHCKGKINWGRPFDPLRLINEMIERQTLADKVRRYLNHER